VSDATATTTDTDALLKAGDLARLLSCDERTVWRWASAGTIPPPIRIGGCTRWRRADLDAFLQGKAQAAAREAARYEKAT